MGVERDRPMQVGDTAPDFTLHRQDWTLMRGLADTAGKVRILAAVPSLDTDVCDRETRRFNQEAATLGADIVIEVISTDLPYAQKRWCGAAGSKAGLHLRPCSELTARVAQVLGCQIAECGGV